MLKNDQPNAGVTTNRRFESPGSDWGTRHTAGLPPGWAELSYGWQGLPAWSASLDRFARRTVLDHSGRDPAYSHAGSQPLGGPDSRNSDYRTRGEPPCRLGRAHQDVQPRDVRASDCH